MKPFTYFQHRPASLALSSEDVDKRRQAPGRIGYASRDFKRLLPDLQ